MNQQVVFTPETMEQFISKLREEGIIGSGGAYILATWEEYMQFKMYMNIKIGGMLPDKPSFDEIEKEQQIL